MKTIDFTKINDPLKQHILKYFYTRNDFDYKGYTGTYFFESNKLIALSKPNRGKDITSKIEILIFDSRSSEDLEYGIEIMIKCNISQSEETVFCGWINNTDTLYTVLDSIGVLYKDPLS